MTENNKSPHILNASPNLLGFCFVVLTSIKILNLQDKTLVDDISIFSFICFMTSSLISFLAITSKLKSSIYYEKIADYAFIIGLVLLFLTVMLLAFNMIK
jgi:hypothetical protein